MSTPRRIAVIASGSGSNMAAIAAACERGDIPATLSLVISNVPHARVLARAAEWQLPNRCINHRDYESRGAFEEAMLQVLQKNAIDLVVLAGFMRILTDRFIREYYGSLLNIHPSLLPKYPGLNTHQRALDAGDEEAGATVHFVIPELDAGPTIVQARVPVLSGDDASSLAARVQAQEHQIYPLAVRWCVEKKVELRKGKVWKDPSLTSNGTNA
ncbi:phosphoribosylglycinamide formyltransferase [Congregibacter sp.]|uniref:phosphoribosylglycinamide formyltransferase n=1 Tax=Congregibacter sp. TaxID=2744308 RepID=UPI003F6D5DC7